MEWLKIEVVKKAKIVLVRLWQKIPKCECSEHSHEIISWRSGNLSFIEAPNTKNNARPSRGRPKQYQYKQLESKINTENDPLLELK